MPSAMKHRVFLSLFAGVATLMAEDPPAPQTSTPETVLRAAAPSAPMTLVLPTDNDALLRGKPEEFYMFVDRNFEGEKTTPWQGGCYGCVRNSVRVGDHVEYTHFHEGIDIAPVKRDEKDEPQDEVRSISQGEVVHCSDAPGGSNYGRYIVIKHDWGQGPMYSLYAHLAKILVKEGDKVETRTPIAVMGHTGAGIDRRRSHTHLELNLFLNSHFGEWHDANFKDYPNRHGNYNGLNLAGIDIAALYLERQKNPSLTIAEFVKRQPPTFKVLVPRKGDIELLQNYPWLGEGCEQASPSWELSFTGGGVPVKITPSAETVTAPKASWVKDEGMPVSYHTRGHVIGSATKFSLTSAGLHYIQLITGDFSTPPVVAKKSAPPASPKRKTSPKKK